MAAISSHPQIAEPFHPWSKGKHSVMFNSMLITGRMCWGNQNAGERGLEMYWNEKKPSEPGHAGLTCPHRYSRGDCTSLGFLGVQDTDLAGIQAAGSDFVNHLDETH